MERRYLTAKELSEYIGKSLPAIYTDVSRRKIPFIRVGRLTRFDRTEVDKWMESQRVEPFDMNKRI